MHLECFEQKRKEVSKDINKEIETTAIKEGDVTIKSKKQLSQIIDTTLLKCYLQVLLMKKDQVNRYLAVNLAGFLCIYSRTKLYIWYDIWLNIQIFFLTNYYHVHSSVSILPPCILDQRCSCGTIASPQGQQLSCWRKWESSQEERKV